MNYLDQDGRIPTYRIQEEFELMQSLSDTKPSKRITKTKKGLKAMKALIELEKNNNISWYEYLKIRNIENLDDIALFYRGNKISFRRMFEKSDELAKSMTQSGLTFGNEIGVCVSNTPELVYILLAANKLGLKVNLFGAEFDKRYLENIINDVSKKVMFISDDNYDKLKNLCIDKQIENLVIVSLADSLPKNAKECDEYEPELDNYYHYENKAIKIIKELENSILFDEYIKKGYVYNEEILSYGNLETDFLITYTSGSTKIGFPKAIIHRNRSLIAMGRFHDPELSGNPKIPGLRGLAHIHPESNTDVITCISDNLIQGWSVALEPEYAKEKILDYVILNKPNYLNATTSFLIEMSKQYLVDKKYHKNGTGKKFPFLLATFAVGEPAQKGEEKFINRFLRESRAGSGVSIMGLKMPFTTLSVGGGDCEHGGIYYTLWKTLYQKLYTPILGKNELGLLPVPYVVVTALKKNKEGQFIECDYNEYGEIVANSYTNLSCYKNNLEATNDLIIEDNLGRKWVSCKTYGYIDKVGGVHVKGRITEKKKTMYETYEFDDIVTNDTKNILSCTTVEIEGNYVMNIQFQPFTRTSKEKIINSIYERLVNKFPEEIINSMCIRVIKERESFPLTGAGKRSVKALEDLKYSNTSLIYEEYNLEKEKINKKILKKQK